MTEYIGRLTCLVVKWVPLSKFGLQLDLEVDLQIDQASMPDIEKEWKKINFQNVRSLTIGELDMSYVAHLSIQDVRSNQLDKINFSVTEEEHNLFSFCCESFLDCGGDPALD